LRREIAIRGRVHYDAHVLAREAPFVVGSFRGGIHVFAVHHRAICIALGFALSFGSTGALAAPALAGGTDDVPVVAQATQENADAFNDVPPDHWAYQAVQELAADGYLKGYPDGTFRGNRPLTRYELVSFIDRALSSIIAAQINGEDVNARDLANIKKLMTQYSGDLKDLQGQVASIKTRLVDDEARRTQDESDIAAVKVVADSAKREADATVAVVARVHGGLQFSYKTASAFLNYEATNGPYARAAGAAGTLTPPVAANAPFPAYYGAYPGITRGIAFANGPGATNSPYTGPTTQGASEFGIRPIFAGNLDTHLSYNVRLSFIDQVDTPLGLTSDNKAYCTSAPPAAGGLPGSSLGSYPCAYQDNSGFGSSLAFNINRFSSAMGQPAGRHRRRRARRKDLGAVEQRFAQHQSVDRLSEQTGRRDLLRRSQSESVDRGGRELRHRPYRRQLRAVGAGQRDQPGLFERARPQQRHDRARRPSAYQPVLQRGIRRSLRVRSTLQ
jgi:hypothetical protein